MNKWGIFYSPLNVSLMEITKEVFKKVCEESNGPGKVIKNLGGHDNGTWRRKIKKLSEEYQIKIPKYTPKRNYEVIEKSCVICGKLFTTQKGHAREKTVCSHSCSNTYFRSGKNNPNYKDGHKGEKIYRTICFEHHERKCCICGFDLIVDVHHLDCNKHNNDPMNLVPLCPNHHKLFHSKYRQLVEPLIKEYLHSGISRKV